MKKTKSVVASKISETPKVSINLDGTAIECCVTQNSFKRIIGISI